MLVLIAMSAGAARAGPQYLSLHSLLDELSAFSTRQANGHLRPRSRPKAGPAARRWWHYAITMAVQKGQQQTLPWPQFLKASPPTPAYDVDKGVANVLTCWHICQGALDKSDLCRSLCSPGYAQACRIRHSPARMGLANASGSCIGVEVCVGLPEARWNAL